jgi:hypothetical protein
MSFHYASAVILGIDSAKTGASGSTLLVPRIEAPLPGKRNAGPRATVDASTYTPRVVGYTFEHYCQVKKQLDRENCVLHLCERALELGLPAVVVAETWTPGMSLKATLGMGEGWGWWTAEINRALERLPELGLIHVEKVVPDQWRGDLYGRGPHVPKDRDGLKAAAKNYIKLRMGVRLENDDVAEAGCVGLWGAQCDSVHEAVKKWRSRRAENLRKVQLVQSKRARSPS